MEKRLLDQFTKSADQPAVWRKREADVTYAQLGHMITTAQRIISENRATIIGVLSTRSLEAYVAVLASYFAKVRFVPLNPDLPDERLEKVVTAGNVQLVLCDKSTVEIADRLGTLSVNLTEQLENQVGVTAATTTAGKTFELASAERHEIAYQMFTSGSTGDPKGVPISYGNLNHYVETISDTVKMPTGARCSQLFDLSFDLSMHDIFVTLTNGGMLCPASKMDLMMPNAYLAKKKIDVWFSVPMIAAIAIAGQADKPVNHKLKLAMFCGEALPSQYATDFCQFLEDDSSLYNLYGPTEATIAFTAKQFATADQQYSSVPLGTGFGDNDIGVEFEDGRISSPCASPKDLEALEGQEGELLLSGPQVFAGYSPHTNTNCFVEHEGVRFYRSGDLIRFENGEVLHLGRTDNQIKIRGYRIELGDIEAAVRKAFGFSSVAAVVLGEMSEQEIGLAYESDADLTDPTALNQLLPDYMLPARWLRVEKMPTNVNQKIDRKWLKKQTWPS